jgi:hypothetical protein
VPNLPPEAYNAPAAPTVASVAGDVETGVKNTAAKATAINLGDEYKDVLGDLRRTFIIFIGLAIAMIIGSILMP